jgi:hypothetical protein
MVEEIKLKIGKHDLVLIQDRDGSITIWEGNENIAWIFQEIQGGLCIHGYMGEKGFMEVSAKMI